MILALIEQPWTEIGAFVGVVSLVVGFLGGLLLLWLASFFIKKSTYWNDRREWMLDLDALQKRVTALEQEQKLAKQPIATMQKSVDEMKDELKKLTETIGGLKDSMIEGLHGLENRTIALEAKGGKGGP